MGDTESHLDTACARTYLSLTTLLRSAPVTITAMAVGLYMLVSS